MNRSERGAAMLSNSDGEVSLNGAARLIQAIADQKYARSTLYRDCFIAAEAVFPKLTRQKQLEIGTLWHRHTTLTQHRFVYNETSADFSESKPSLEELVAAHLNALETDWTLDLHLEADSSNLRNWGFFDRPFELIYRMYKNPLEKLSEYTVDSWLLSVYRQAGEISENLAKNAIAKRYQNPQLSNYAAIVAGAETRWALGQPYLHKHGLYRQNPWTPIVDMYQLYPDHVPLGPRCWQPWTIIRRPVPSMFLNGYFLIYTHDPPDLDLE